MLSVLEEEAKGARDDGSSGSPAPPYGLPYNLSRARASEAAAVAAFADPGGASAGGEVRPGTTTPPLLPGGPPPAEEGGCGIVRGYG